MGILMEKIMRKFSNVYNSYWLVVETITTIGYGDIYPTTYFGRVLAIIACIFGTFVLTLLIVFLNTYIVFDEYEKAVYYQVLEDDIKANEMKKDSINMIWVFLKLNYLRKNTIKNTNLKNFYLYLDLKYMSKNFKILRLNSLRKDVNIEEILGNIRGDLDKGVEPMKKQLEVYNKERILSDDSFNKLKISNLICESFFKNSMQIWNLVRILNKENYLEGLNTIDEVYDSQVKIYDEILYFHKSKNNKQEQDEENTLDEQSHEEKKDGVEPNETENIVKEKHEDLENENCGKDKIYTMKLFKY